MKKTKKFTILILVILFLCACNKKEEYKINEDILLTGTIQVKEIINEGKKAKVTYLELEKAITINDKTISKIELNTEQELKNDTKATIKGKIEDSGNLSVLDLDYIFSVTDIDNVLSYVNSFTNGSFSFSIPANLIKICTVREIENGFIIYSKSNLEVGGEIMTIKAVTSSDFKELQNTNIQMEKVKSDSKKTIVIIYPTSNEYKEEFKDEYEQIGDQINTIKNTITIK